MRRPFLVVRSDAYTSAVKKSKSYYNKGSADIAGTSFSTGVIIGMIIANVAFPPSVIIDSVLAALGVAFIKLAVSGVKNYVNSSEKRKDASDYYVIIRTYWKEIINKHMMQKNRSMVYESYN